MQRIPSLFIQEVEKKGRGVFTASPISEGDLIEICPLIVMPESEAPHLDKTKLSEHYFIIEDEEKLVAIALGYGQLYNHSKTPNAEVELRGADKQMLVRCVRSIEVGEEITIDYLPLGESKIKLWFSDEDLREG